MGMVGPATKPLGSTMDSLLVHFVHLQDEVSGVDAMLLMAPMADLKVSTWKL